LEDFLDDLVLNDWLSANRAQVQLTLVVVDIVVEPLAEAGFVELVLHMASELANALAWLKIAEADRAVQILHLLLRKGGVDRGTKSSRLADQEALAWGLISCSLSLLNIALSERLPSSEVQAAHVLELTSANRMVLEVIETAKLVRNEVKGDNSVLEKLVVAVVVALIAAASQNRVQDEDWDACDDEDRVLQEENDQIGVQVRPVPVESRVPFYPFVDDRRVFQLLYHENGGAHDRAKDDPLSDSPSSEAAVTAGLDQAAVAKSPVNAVEEAQAESHTLHLRVEAPVDQQVMVEKMKRDDRDDHTGQDE